MRTLHTALRVGDLGASLVFHAALGYQQVGCVEPEAGTMLVMLKLPEDAVVTLELVHGRDHGPVELGTGISHRVVQVEDLETTVAALTCAGLRPSAIEHPGGQEGPRTCWLVDPDGYRIELVQWPAGHPDGITAADFT